MPPWEEIREALLYWLLPSTLASAAVFFAVSRLLPRHGVSLAGLLAVTAGLFAGYETGDAIEFRLDSDRQLEPRELADTAYRAVMGIPPPDPEAAKIPLHYWLPWAAWLAGLAGLLARLPRLPWVIAWLIALATAIIAARLIVRFDLRLEIHWLWPALAALILSEWKVLESAGKSYPGLSLPLGISAAFAAASGVIIHSHSARLAEIAVIFGGGWLGIALVAAWRRQDCGGTAPLAAVLLPSLMLIANQVMADDCKVPLASFVLVAISPMAFALPSILRAFGRTSPRLIFASLIVLLLVNAIAVGLAAQAESIAVD